ncbi:MAG: iron ABC transporter permease [Candidatus Methanosuratincola petrocarbonis]|nr:iron ABC transporter permease [Candidatus Methanosuratincola sp.]
MPRKGLLISALLLLPLPVLVVSLFVGVYSIDPLTVLSMLAKRIFDPSGTTPWPEVYETIVFNIRMPRILLALVGGIALSVSGASLQGIFRNPLVDTYILGVSAGAGLGAALGIAYFPGIPGSVQSLSFAMGFTAFFTTYTVAKSKGETPVISLVLAGVIVTALFSALLSIIKFFTESEKLAGVVYWMMGSLAVTGWGPLGQTAPLILVGFAVVFLMRWRINVLSMGDEEAKALGINVGRDRFIVLLASTLMVSAFVSVAGIIGWIGLVVPHTVRMLLGTPDNRVVVPVSASLGAVFLMVADDLARSVASFELPVGVITTLVGAPFFLYLLKLRGGSAWK